MEVTALQIKALRDETGVSVMQCKAALEEANGDMEKARMILRKYGSGASAKKADRTLGGGTIGAYVHTTNAVAALVLLSCETDFVAKNEAFMALARDIAMQIVAMNPETTEDLLEQQFIKDENKTVDILLNEATQKFGERIVVTAMSRLSVK
jgi:elongation factor Ts